MKDNRFIELVNLYIDRQITAAETAELEAEMQGNPQRRAVYRQYCRMHSATKQVYHSFRTEAHGPQPGASAGHAAITDFKRRPRVNWIHYAGGLAAAACLALVFVRYDADSGQTANPPANVVANPQVAPVVAALPPTPHAAAPSLISLRNNLDVEPSYQALAASLQQDELRTYTQGGIPSGRLPSLFDDGVFDARPFAPANSQRVFRSKQGPAQQAEFTAFQFQR
ncbi:MAG: hypothetical protein JNG82_02365 [Opitutaceae bacterium]|nr:hypothetical protein [Opitutaceae bacterium]